jgi:hypothetical protein
MNTKRIAVFSALMVFALAATSFIISYDALRGLASSTGAVSGVLSFLFPLVVDGAIIVFGLAAVGNSLTGESARLDLALVVAATMASIAMNVIHAPDDLVARCIAAAPPVFLFFSFERLMSMLKSEVRKSGMLASLAETITLLDTRRAEAIKAEAHLVKLQEAARQAQADVRCAQSDVKSLQAECKRMQAQAQAYENGRKVHDSQVLALFGMAPHATQAEAASALGITRQWLGSALARMIGEGVIARNGKGVEIINAK